MSQMLQLIKSSSVPAAVMRSAAKGALSLPSAEMLQILVYLTGNAVFGQEAAMTLAGWDQPSALAVLSSPDAPGEVVAYFLDPNNQRPALMPALIENPQASESQIMALASGAKRDVIELLLASPRVKAMPDVMKALLENANLTEAQDRQLRHELGPESPEPIDPESQAAHAAWTEEHSAEIEAEEGTAFELTGGADDEEETSAPAAADAAASTQPRLAKTGLPATLKVSTLVKLSRMNVAQRVRQGFLGSREERSILIRDSARIVQNSVLASPKLSEPEVETFAAAKNVSENVLREISRSRRFIKIYAVVRALVNNPRCPLDLSLTLVKNLLVMDLKNLQGNKNVPETLRKVATKLYKEKKAPVGQKAEH